MSAKIWFDQHRLVLERSAGWPTGLGQIILALGAAVAIVAFIMLEDVRRHFVGLGMMFMLLGLMLLLWRRGVTLDPQSATLTRWWGLQMPGRSMMLRQTNTRPLSGFSGLRVVKSGASDHYKTWRRGMYRIQFEKSESVAGQLSLRERLIVDDEFTSNEEASTAAQAIARFLGMSVIEAR
jgi:hypothetical protein